MTTATKLNLQAPNEKLYVPEEARILKVEKFTEKEKFFMLELVSGRNLGHVPGQFIQLSILGIGEAPISISSPPSSDNKFEICVRAVGDVTGKLHTLKEGDIVHIRGPFGRGFNEDIQKRLLGKHLLFIAGGIGYVPMRSLINKVLTEPNKYKKIQMLYGCKTPQDRVYQKELSEIKAMGGNIELKETVDHADGTWYGAQGVITSLIKPLEIKAADTIAIIVGPPVMYKFVLIELLNKDIPKKNIYMSLERRMKCGIGKCGHCQMEGIYVCQEGPVFNYADVEGMEEAL